MKCLRRSWWHEQRMTRKKNNLGCESHCCALRAGTHKTAKQQPISICVVTPQGAGQQSIWQTAVFHHLKNMNYYSSHWVTVWETYQTVLFREKNPSKDISSILLRYTGNFQCWKSEIQDGTWQQHFSQQSTRQRAVHLHRCFFSSIWDMQSLFMEHQQCFGVSLMFPPKCYCYKTVHEKCVCMHEKKSMCLFFHSTDLFPLQIIAKL